MYLEINSWVGTQLVYMLSGRAAELTTNGVPC